jgi:DNA polymerase-3 subunit beta
MIFSVSQSALKRGIGIVSHAVPNKTSLPILVNIKITAVGDVLTLQATDLQMAITYTMPCIVSVPGDITLPAKLFSDVISNLANEQIVITIDPLTDTATIKTAKSNISVNGISTYDFPALPEIQDLTSIGRISILDFRPAINQVVVAAASDDSRPVLAGIHFQLEADTTIGTMSAADGFRLANRKIEFSERNSNNAVELVIPSKAMQEVSRMLAIADGSMEMLYSENNAGFVVNHTDNGTMQLIARLIHGKYPDIQRVIPKEFGTRVVVNTAELSKAIKISRLFSVNDANVVKLSFSPTEGIEVSASGDGKGKNVTHVDAEIEGVLTVIGLNVKYIEEALGSVTTDKVVIELNSEKSPAVFIPFEWTLYKHIVMPMMVR